MTRAISSAVVLSSFFAIAPATPADPPDAAKTHIVTYRAGMATELGDGEHKDKFHFQTADGKGIKNAEVSVHLVSAPKPLGPFRTDTAGDVLVNTRAAHGIHCRVDGILLMCHDGPGAPREIIVGPEPAKPTGGTTRRPDGLYTVVTARGGPNRTPEGTSEQRVTVLNRAGKPMEGLVIMIAWPGNKRAEYRTDRHGVAVVRLDARSDSVGVGIGAGVPGPAVWLDRGVIRWPLEVTYMTPETKVTIR